MMATEVHIVQTTWKEVKSLKNPVFHQLFYQKLFELDEDIKDLFQTDYSISSKRLMSLIDYLVSNLNNGSIIREIGAIGARLSECGITTKHFVSIKEALLWSLEKQLGCKWTPDLGAAWAWCFSTVGSIIRRTPRAMN